MTIECHFQAKHRGGASEFLPDTPFKLPILDSRPFPLAERLTARAEAELLRETYVTYLGITLQGDQQ